MLKITEEEKEEEESGHKREHMIVDRHLGTLLLCKCNASALCVGLMCQLLFAAIVCLLACPPGAFPDLIADFIGSVVHYYHQSTTPPRAA